MGSVLYLVHIKKGTKYDRREDKWYILVPLKGWNERVLFCLLLVLKIIKLFINLSFCFWFS